MLRVVLAGIGGYGAGYLEALLSQPGTAQQLTKRLQTALLAHSGNMQDNTTLVLIKRHR